MSKNHLSLSERMTLYSFYAGVGFSATVMFFCMYMLAHPGQKKSNNDAGYFTLLGSAISLFVNPTGAGKKESNVAVDSERTTIVANREQGE